MRYFRLILAACLSFLPGYSVGLLMLEYVPGQFIFTTIFAVLVAFSLYAFLVIDWVFK